MKKIWMISMLTLTVASTATAQDDDLYFVPKKTAEKVVTDRPRTVEREEPAYYVGSDRDVDEYNRRGRFRSRYQHIGEGNDIIDFEAGDGLYPDSTYVDTLFAAPQTEYWADDFDDDYRYSRRMSRFDDYYGFYDPWYYRSWGYGPYWRTGYYPWYDSWYYPWYSGWYDPWYYGYAGWYGGWYRPWYYGYGYGYGYGWGYPWYSGHYYSYNGPTGTQNHGRINYGGTRGMSNGRTTSFGNGRFGGTSISRNAGTSAGTRGTYTPSRSGVYSNSNGNFGGSRSSSSTAPTRSYTPSSSSPSRSSGSFGGGGGFGGSRSSGGSFGGGGRSGGGSFGGRR